MVRVGGEVVRIEVVVKVDVGVKCRRMGGTGRSRIGRVGVVVRIRGGVVRVGGLERVGGGVDRVGGGLVRVG